MPRLREAGAVCSMSGFFGRATRSVWDKRWSPELWLLAANLASRLLGFAVSLLVSRLAGVQALGVYSGLLITASSPTTPMAAALAHNATMMTARAGSPAAIRSVLLAHTGVLVLSASLAIVGSFAMIGFVGLQDAAPFGGLGFGALVVALVLGQLMTPFVMGLHHGADVSMRAAGVTLAWTAAALLATYPVVRHAGLEGALWQSAAVGALPAICLSVWVLLSRRRGGESRGQEMAADLAREARDGFRRALPSVLATVLNNATNWLACIYLAERAHGVAGVGVIAIGLQWMALMLLPLTSWSGRVMRALTVAHQEGQLALASAIRSQIRRCVAVTLCAGLLVAALSPWIADLYKVDRGTLVVLIGINAVACGLFGVAFVYERVCFCIGGQRKWLIASVCAYGVQLAFTWAFIDESIWVVALGNLIGVGTLMSLMWMWIKQLMRGMPSSQEVVR